MLYGSAGPDPRSTTAPVDYSWGFHAPRMTSIPHPSRIENKRRLNFYMLLITVSKKVLQLPSYKNHSNSKLKEMLKIISREVPHFAGDKRRPERAWQLAKVTDRCREGQEPQLSSLLCTTIAQYEKTNRQTKNPPLAQNNTIVWQK